MLIDVFNLTKSKVPQLQHSKQSIAGVCIVLVPNQSVIMINLELNF